MRCAYARRVHRSRQRTHRHLPELTAVPTMTSSPGVKAKLPMSRSVRSPSSCRSPAWQDPRARAARRAGVRGPPVPLPGRGGRGPEGPRATGRARGRGPRAGQQFRGSGPRARERARERDQRHPARPGREHRRARRAAAAVKARRTPQDPLWSPKSPSPPRPPVRPAGVFLKFLTFGEHICFHRYLVGAAARGISTLESNPRRGGDDPQSYPAPARGWALQPVSRGTSPCLAS